MDTFPLTIKTRTAELWIFTVVQLQQVYGRGIKDWCCSMDHVAGKDLIIIIITTTIFIVLSSTAPAICESSLWFILAKISQRQVAGNS